MLSELIETLTDKFWLLSPFVVIKQYERGIILRWGVFDRYVECGPCWKCPVMHEVLSIEVNQQTFESQSQTLTTRDGMSITISSVVQYWVHDPSLYLIGVFDGEKALSDAVLAAVSYHVERSNYDDLQGSELSQKVTRRVRRAVKEYGIKIKWLAFADKTKTIPIRLMTD